MSESDRARHGASRRHGLGAMALAMLVAGAQAPAHGEDPTPPVALDNLLRLPTGYQAPPPPPEGGATLDETEWREKFAEAQRDVFRAQRKLDASEEELREIAKTSDTWSLAPPGSQAQSPSGPLSYELRQRLDRQRAELERAEKALQSLQIQANIAGVPEEWRGEE